MPKYQLTLRHSKKQNDYLNYLSSECQTTKSAILRFILHLAANQPLTPLDNQIAEKLQTLSPIPVKIN